MTEAEIDHLFALKRYGRSPSVSRPNNKSYNSNEIDGWSWGAFGLTFIWGLYHNVLVSLLIFIPIVNLVVLIMLGIKGRRWAWEKGNWSDVKSFKMSQEKWDTAGIIVFFISLFGIILRLRYTL